MKIFHAAETIRGGVATVIRHNVMAQAREFEAGNITVLMPRSQAEDIDDAKPFSGFVFERDGRNLRSFYSFLKKFIYIVLREKPDVIHLHSSFAGLLGRLALVMLCFSGYSPKVIYCPHGFGFIMEGAKWKKKIYALVERILLPTTDAAICVSDYERRTAIAFGLPERKLKVIHNGVPAEENSDKEIKQNKEKVTNLLFLGRLDFAKGFDLALRAMKELESDPFHLTVVGSAVQSGEKPPELSNITYTGWVSPDRVGSYIRACDVVMMPSRWESFGLAAAEAAAHGKPSLASNRCALPEVVLDGKTGKLFPADNVSEAVRILKETTKEEWAAMGDAAREYVTKEFSVDKMTQKTMNLYRQVSD